MNWNYTEPPKDRQFLADINYPWVVICTYNEPSEGYVYAQLEVDMYEGEWKDTSYICEYCKRDEIIAWAEIPKHDIKKKVSE